MTRLYPTSRPAVQRARLVVAAAAVFFVDTTTTVEIVIPVLYVSIVLLAMRTGRRGDTAAAGWGSVGLTMISLVATLDVHRSNGTALVNTALSVLAIGSVTALGLQTLRAQSDARRDRDRVLEMARGISLRGLTAFIVHEITQPLAAIGAEAGAACRWLSRESPDMGEARSAALRIADQVARASTLVDRLRTFVSRGTVTMTRCNLAALVETAVSHLRQDLDEAAVDIEMALPVRVDVRADPLLLEQVVIGTITNAVEALLSVPPGSRRVHVDLAAEDGKARLAIRDTGMGASAIGDMFDPFFTTKAEHGGMGIGLAVSRTIVDAHGGSIDAAPNVPRGLVIEIAMPLYDAVGSVR